MMALALLTEQPTELKDGHNLVDHLMHIFIIIVVVVAVVVSQSKQLQTTSTSSSSSWLCFGGIVTAAAADVAPTNHPTAKTETLNKKTQLCSSFVCFFPFHSFVSFFGSVEKEEIFCYVCVFFFIACLHAK